MTLNAVEKQIVSGDTPRESLPDPKTVLSMSPCDLADFVDGLYKTGRLETFFDAAGEILVRDLYIPLLSYWEKWFSPACQRALDELAQQYLPKCDERDSASLPLALHERFDIGELRLLFREMVAVQLSFGCSGCCPRCMFDAPYGVRGQMEDAKKIIRFAGKTFFINRPPFYWASDPRDYPEYAGLHALAKSQCGYDPEVTTKVSDNAESLHWLQELSRVARHVRISLFHIMDTGQIEELLGKISTVTDGRFRAGSSRAGGFHVAESHDSRLAILKVLDSPDAIQQEYELALRREGYQAPPPYEGHTSGCGLTFTKPRHAKCDSHNGTLLTPRGIYNVLRLTVGSEKFPQNQMVVPITGFEDIKLEPGDYLPHILPHCVVENKGYVYPPYDPDVGYVPDEELFAQHVDDILTTTLKTPACSFNVSYGNDGIVTQAVPKLACG